MIIQTQNLSDSQIDSAVSNIIAAYGTTERDFQMASNQYNSVFFRGLPFEFVQRACTALKNHFDNYQNNFWNKNVVFTEQL